MDKIYITGTGRCGTTFLIKLFSFLGFDTGYDIKNYKNHISKNCNSGMEKHYNSREYIIKNPCIMRDIKQIISDDKINIKAIIIPIRNYVDSAKSRVSHKNNSGGLWHAKDEKTQCDFYYSIMSNYIYYMTKYDINTIFIDFDRMINNKKYLYDKLSSILQEKNITFIEFCSIYDNTTRTC